MPKKKENLSPEERVIKAVIPKEEEPYKLPNNWVWTTSENIFIEISSNNKKIKQKDYLLEGKIPVIDQGKKLIGGYTNNTEMDLYKEELPVVVFGDHTLNLKYIDFPFIIGADGVKVLKTISSYNSKFLYYCIKNLNLKSLGYRRHFPILKSEKFQLPPLEEQKRIVEKLDSLFEKIGKIKEIIEEVKEKASSRKEAILSKAFTGELTEKWRAENETENAKELLLKINEEKLKNNPKAKIKDISEMVVNEDEIPYKVPNNWVWTRLENISEKITDGAHKTPTYVKEGIPFISVKDIRNNEIFFDDTKFISLEEHKELYKRCNPERGDVLVTKSGTIGRTAVVKDDFEFSLFVSVALIKNIKNVINSNFLSYAMQDFINKIDVSRDIKGGVIKNYHISDMKKQLVPLPPLEEQKEIVRILDKVFEDENKISELISLEEKVEILEKTILDKAFRGELGTGNIDDEPAIELLKKTLENC